MHPQNGCKREISEILRETKQKTYSLRPYGSDKRVAEFLEYAQPIISSVADLLKTNTCLTEEISKELAHFDKRHRLASTFVMAAILNGRPLGM